MQKAIRTHWGIKNELHFGLLKWLYGQINRESEKETLLRHFAVNLLKQEETAKDVAATWVKDFNSREWLSAKKTFFVVGSDSKIMQQ